MPHNMTRRILSAHLRSGELVAGSDISVAVDQLLLQDATGTMAWLQFLELDVPRVRVPLCVQYVDHNLIQLDFRNPDDHRFLQSLCARYGVLYSRPGNGISHYLHLERFDRPGHLLLGADSHTTTAGAMGMFAVGAGGLDAAVVMGGRDFELTMPNIVRVELVGHLKPWVQSKDVILELLRRRTVRGGKNKFFEFTGEGVASLSVTERATICNMIAELGATGAIFPSDERVREWLRAQGRENDWVPLAADPGAGYDEEERIDLGELEPLIACPSSPDNVVPVREVAGTPVAQVCVGSSVNSGYEDLAIAAFVLKDRTVHPDCVMTVTPGSRQILDTILQTSVYRDLVGAGARMLEPVCGPCVGLGQAPPSGAVSVRTFNRNFPGRSGTEADLVYLCSPATAAATALKGAIADPRTLGVEPSLAVAVPSNPLVDDLQILQPPPEHAAAAIAVTRGPNIKAPPPQTALPESIGGPILIVLGDDVSTGDLSPDGANVLALRSNVEQMANFVLRRFDETFADRARAVGGGLIVAGENYGQGSSREHAVLAPKALGVRAIVAKSFARIHRRNLIAQGIPPLLFADPGEYCIVEAGQVWEIVNLRAVIESGMPLVRCRRRGTVSETTIVLRHDLTPHEGELLLAGGLLAYLRSEMTVRGAIA